jgi:hypothetical protein
MVATSFAANLRIPYVSSVRREGLKLRSVGEQSTRLDLVDRCVVGWGKGGACGGRVAILVIQAYMG